MTVIINTATINVGGAVQVAINVIKQSFLIKDLDIFYITNQYLFDLIPVDRSKVLIVSKSPAGLLNSKEKKQIKNFADDVNPDVIYSVGAPSYVSFNQEEVLRLTNPWIINSLFSEVYSIFSPIQQNILRLKILVQRQFLKRPKYFITQTEDAKTKIVLNLGKENKNVFVVPNTISSNFEGYLNEDFQKDYNDNLNVLIIAAPYPHKNLKLVCETAKILKERGIDKIKFKITYPKEEFDQSDIGKLINKYKITEYVENIGKIPLSHLPDIYKKSHVLLLPTLLEVFSVSLLEAMVFKVPIITTNYSFNTDVCGNAALYINNPFDANEVVDCLLKIKESEELREQLIKEGQEIINKNVNNNDIYLEHFKIIKQIAAKK